MKVLILAMVLFGLGIGMVVYSLIQGDTGSGVHCFNGKVEVASRADASVTIIGEAIICGRDWHISNIYGPSIEAWDGPINFEEFDPGQGSKYEEERHGRR